MRKRAGRSISFGLAASVLGAVFPSARVWAQTPAVHQVEQGPSWTGEKRILYYSIDQGSQLIPLAG